MDRDFFMTPEEALEFRLIDNVVQPKSSAESSSDKDANKKWTLEPVK